MKRIFLFLCVFFSLSAQAAQVLVDGARVWSESDKTRVVLDAESTITHRIFTLDDPSRVVVDIDNAKLTGALPRPDQSDPTLVGMRSGVRGGNDLRVVLDLKHPVRVKSFLLPPDPDKHKDHRLVIDLLPQRPGKNGVPKPILTLPEAPATASAPQVFYKPLIAIDAGHGGVDPGAIGASGTHEKAVVLSIARRLAKLIGNDPSLRYYLTRDTDKFIPLRQRVSLARSHKADLFISIHADAFTDPRAHGSSVFTISYRGASSEAARLLANSENKADLLGGVNIKDTDDTLAGVLIDMSQNATIEHSNEAATAVLGNLGKIGPRHSTKVQRAGFVVLKAPDIPSMLVETAFLSNSEEERRLNTAAYQQKIAQAIYAGVKQYFHDYPAYGDLARMASNSQDARRHVIAQGDTLSGIAQQYRVSLSSLRAENGLKGDTIRVGQVLAIPGGS